MNLKLQNIFYQRFKVAILLLYLPFFAVQCFFNYSNIVQGNSGALFAQYQKTTTGKPVSLNTKPYSKLVTVSLNKRFQPAVAPFCNTISIELPPCFTVTKLFKKYTLAFYSNACLHKGTLRGPPAVA